MGLIFDLGLLGYIRLAVKYLFLADQGEAETNGEGITSTKLRVEPFNALLEQNDYEVCPPSPTNTHTRYLDPLVPA